MAAALVAGSSWAASDASLEQLQATYARSVGDVEAESARQAQAWPAKYLAGLETLEKDLQRAGDLDGVLAVRRESERFRQSGDVPDDALIVTPAALRTLQDQARAVPERIALDRSRKIVALADQYAAALDKLKAAHTTRGSLDAALAAQEEIKRLKDDPKVTAARFAVDEADSRAASAVAAPAPAAAVKSVPKAAKPESPQLQRVPESLRESLALYLAFDTNDRLGVTDCSGRQRDGRMTGARWTAKGAMEGGCAFDGKAGAVTLADSKDWDIRADADWSFACFLQMEGEVANAGLYRRGAAASSSGAAGNALSYRTAVEPQGLCWGAVNGEWRTGARLLADRWQHVVLVYRAAERTALAYVNGREQARTAVRSVDGGSGPFVLGGDSRAGVLKGVLDEVMVFTRALSHEDVRTLFAALGGERIQREADEHAVGLPFFRRPPPGGGDRPFRPPVGRGGRR